VKILLDTCVWGGAVVALVRAGHDVIWTGAWQEDPGDEEILSFAEREGRVLNTLDQDFGELAVVSGMQHAGLVRVVNVPARMQAKAIARVLGSHQDDLLAGALITVGPGRIRIRAGSRAR
jgi:predicted nuclease of predicted toxin-antitoxin system